MSEKLVLRTVWDSLSLDSDMLAYNRIVAIEGRRGQVASNIPHLIRREQKTHTITVPSWLGSRLMDFFVMHHVHASNTDEPYNCHRFAAEMRTGQQTYYEAANDMAWAITRRPPLVASLDSVPAGTQQVIGRTVTEQHGEWSDAIHSTVSFGPSPLRLHVAGYNQGVGIDRYDRLEAAYGGGLAVASYLSDPPYVPATVS